MTRTFANDRNEALNKINALESSTLYDRLRTNLPSEETRQYMVKVTGYRKLFVNTAAAPITAMQ